MNLLSVTAAALVAAAVDRRLRSCARPAAPRSGRRAADKPAPREAGGYLKGFRVVAGNRYLLLLSGTMFAAMTVTTLIDARFNTILGEAMT